MSYRLNVPEQLRGLARLARRQKWTIAYTGTGHLLWTSPAGETVLTASTPKGPWEKTNAETRLRRAGLKTRG